MSKRAEHKLITEDFRKWLNEGEKFPTKLSDVDPAVAKVVTKAGSEEHDGNKTDDVINVASGKAFSVSELKPSQSSMNIHKGMGFALDMIAKNKPGGKLGAFISSDNFIMDGHHRWIATAMVDPTAKLIGHQVAYPGTQLIAILNAITVGRLGVGPNDGKPASGGFEQFQAPLIEKKLREYFKDGTTYEDKGKTVVGLTAEQVVATIEGWTGLKGEEALMAAVNKFVENLKSVDFTLPANAPERPDMPVIDKSGVETALGALRGGEVDIKEPFYEPKEKGVQEQKSSKWSSFEEQQLITEDFRKWLNEDGESRWLRQMDQDASYKNRRDPEKERQHRDKMATLRQRAKDSEEYNAEQEKEREKRARTPKIDEDEYNKLVALELEWLQSDRPYQPRELFLKRSEMKKFERYNNLRLRHYEFDGGENDNTDWAIGINDDEADEIVAWRREAHEDKDERDAASKRRKHARSLRGKFEKGVKKGVGKVKDFASDIKDKFFEEHGDKYSGNREMIEEIIDKALSNIDKKKK
jgi:hypothetical protein